MEVHPSAFQYQIPVKIETPVRHAFQFTGRYPLPDFELYYGIYCLESGSEYPKASLFIS